MIQLPWSIIVLKNANRDDVKLINISASRYLKKKLQQSEEIIFNPRNNIIPVLKFNNNDIVMIVFNIYNIIVQIIKYVSLFYLFIFYLLFINFIYYLFIYELIN